MATVISFTCPECKAQLKGPAEMQGKKARCKRCAHVFVLQANGPTAKTVPAAKASVGKPGGGLPARSAPAKPTTPEPPADATEPMTYNFLSEEDTSISEDKSKGGAKAAKPSPHADNNPYGVTELDLTPRCPFCAQEMESAEAIICLHCGYNSQTRSLPAVQRTYANTGGDIFLWLLPGILCVVGSLILVGFICYLWLGLNPDDFKNGVLGEIGAIQGAQVWGTIVSLGIMFFLVRFAIKRLVLHPTPPEMEKK